MAISIERLVAGGMPRDMAKKYLREAKQEINPPSPAQYMRKKNKKKATGKPKGTGSALGIVGSASKAGMQSKQGKGPRRTVAPGFTPKPTGRPPKSVFLRGKPKPKKTGRPTRR